MRLGKLIGIGFFALLVVVVRTALCGEPTSASLNSERHVVVVVWDGMRPDLVTVQNAPTLWSLAQKGVIFRNHHAVYPSATHVNGTAIETGMYPQHSGLIANYDFRPDINREKPISTEQEDVIAKGDKLSRGKYLSVPTLAELIRKAGGKTVVASAKTVGFLLDRQPDHEKSPQGVTISTGESLPAAVASSLEEADGAFPGLPMYSHEERDAWTTAALTQTLWKDGVPAFSLLWLGEPDLTQHETAPGAPAAHAAIKSADENLAAVLAALKQKGLLDKTDIFIVSDHGFSTISRANDLEKYLKQSGLVATINPKEWIKPGQIMMVANGGTVLFYINGHDEPVTDRLVERLQRSDFAGVILTKKEKPGTFPLSRVMIDTPHSPDVVMAFRWSQESNQYGVPGMIEADWSRRAGKGTHATLSRYDMHNILFAAGPDFRERAVDDLPTGNVDLAPTVLKILGINPPAEMDGRVLSEMLKGSEALPVPKSSSDTTEASRDFPDGTWRQYLQQSKVGNTLYLDEGNGAFTARDPK